MNGRMVAWLRCGAPLAAVALVLSASPARADESLRVRQPWSLQTALPTAHAYGASMDLREIPLVHRVYDEVVNRKVWLSPELQLTLVSGTRLMTLDVMHFALFAYTPGSFGRSGTISLETRF